MQRSTAEAEWMPAPTSAQVEGFGLDVRERRLNRLRTFLIVFLAAALIGAGYALLRPAVYRSFATLLVIPPTGAQASENGSAAQTTADGDPVVQGRLLGRYSVLEKIRHRLSADPGSSTPPTITEMQEMLSVVPVGDTNMVELSAEGTEPRVLPHVINTWIDVYTKQYAESRAQLANTTNSELGGQLEGLEAKIAEKRAALDAFRARHDIVSADRAENRALSRLNGLNSALNTALEDRAAAQARLESLRQAAASGKPILRPADESAIARLEERVVEIKEQLSEYRDQYTPAYMELNHEVQAARKRLETVQDKIRAKRQESVQAAIDEAEQTLESTRQRVERLRGELAQIKQQATELTSRYAEYEALQEELTRLEELKRETQQRQVQLEVATDDMMRRLKVLELAFLPTSPIRPQYARDTGIAIGIALLLGLIAVWVSEYLTGSAGQARRRMWPVYYRISDTRESQRPGGHALDASPEHALLPQQGLRELSEDEVRQLLAAADPGKRMLIGLLLSGMTIEEIADLTEQDIDLEAGRINVTGLHPRTLDLPPYLKALFAAGSTPADPVATTALPTPVDTGDPDALLTCLASDAGVAHPQEVTARVLRHTYLAYLVRSGTRLTDLASVAGPLSRAELETYRLISPPGASKTIEQVDTRYPILRGGPHPA